MSPRESFYRNYDHIDECDLSPQWSSGSHQSSIVVCNSSQNSSSPVYNWQEPVSTCSPSPVESNNISVVQINHTEVPRGNKYATSPTPLLGWGSSPEPDEAPSVGTTKKLSSFKSRNFFTSGGNSAPPILDGIDPFDRTYRRRTSNRGELLDE